MKKGVIIAIVALLSTAAAMLDVHAQPPIPGVRVVAPAQLQADALKARSTMVKPSRTTHYEGLFKERLIIKFRDGVVVEASGAQDARTQPTMARRGSTVNASIGFAANRMGPRDRQLMARHKLTEARVRTDMQKASQILRRPAVKAWGPLFSRSASTLKVERGVAERKTKTEHAYLENFYVITLKEGESAASMADEFNAMPSVEIAYLAPIGQDADIPPTTPNYEANQGYLDAAPTGIDARYAWTVPGGNGAGVRMIDLEQSWTLTHEDLRSAFYVNGVMKGDGNHGTAVLGEVVAKRDGHGVSGIAYGGGHGVVSVHRKRTFLFISWTEYNLAEALNVAASRLAPGDVILIEQHAKGPSSGGTCACNCGQFEYLPMEYWQAEYDAIRAATSRGIIVVEAAGNGGMNLDHSRYSSRFNRAVRDSGAIMVGGGSSTNRSPMCWTNYGSRVDVQGWGQNVRTLGYGNIKINGNDKRQWYATGFSGTSSASPIVTGAVMSIQGVRRARQLSYLDSREMRKLLRQTGTPQNGTKQIGPLPNLRAAINGMWAEDCIPFNPDTVQAQLVSGAWKVVSGSMWMLHYGSDQTSAVKARDVIRHYRMNKQCFIKRPSAKMMYFLVNNASPVGSLAGEDCVGFNPATVAAQLVSGNWKVVDGSHWMLDFGTKRDQAVNAVSVIRRYSFTRMCFVKRPNAPMMYFRR